MLNNIHHATVIMAGPTITITITISAILSNNHLATVMMADQTITILLLNNSNIGNVEQHSPCNSYDGRSIRSPHTFSGHQADTSQT